MSSRLPPWEASLMIAEKRTVFLFPMLAFLPSIAGGWRLDPKDKRATKTVDKAPRGNTNKAGTFVLLLPTAGSKHGKNERSFNKVYKSLDSHCTHSKHDSR